MKVRVFLFGLLLSVTAQAQVAKIGTITPKDEHVFTTPLERHVDSVWNGFLPVGKDGIKAVLVQREDLRKYIEQGKGSDFLQLYNKSRALRCAGSLLKKNPDSWVKDCGVLEALVRDVDLKSKDVLSCPALTTVVDDYYALKFIQEGCPVREAWGALRLNLIAETIDSPWDYRRFREVLELNHPALSEKYLQRLPDVFQYNGCTDGLLELKPVIEKYMPEGKLKGRLISMYEKFAPVCPGELAPAFRLKDGTGKEYTLEDFRGKVLVVDVWATWCGGCIEKLPKFMAMRESYKNRSDVEFITISIDDESMINRWKSKVEELHLGDAVNLSAPNTTSFCKDYRILGIPRYFVIDREGRIVSLFTPTSGPLLPETIEKALKK